MATISFSGAVVQWNGTARATTFVSATQLRATITAADIAAPGTAQVSVLDPGGAASGALPFTVAAAPPADGSHCSLLQAAERRGYLSSRFRWEGMAQRDLQPLQVEGTITGVRPGTAGWVSTPESTR